MLILWIRKSKTNGQTSQPKIDEHSFQQHNEDMKRFYLSHPKIETKHPKDIMIADGAVLAAVQTVKLTKHSQN